MTMRLRAHPLREFARHSVASGAISAMRLAMGFLPTVLKLPPFLLNGYDCNSI